MLFSHFPTVQFNVLLQSWGQSPKIKIKKKTIGQICPLLVTRIRRIKRTTIHCNIGPEFFHRP